MKNRNLVVSYPGFFVSEFRDDSLWLKFSGNFFHNIISFDHRDFLHDYFKEISAEPDIKSVVIHSAFHESGSDEYMRFFLMECPERDLWTFRLFRKHGQIRPSPFLQYPGKNSS